MTRAEKHQRWEEMRAYKAQGHTMQEVADKFGLSKQTAQQICKGIKPQKPDLKGKARNQWTSKDFSIRESKAIETVNKYLPEFEYVGGFTHSDGSVNLRCKSCSTVFSRSLIGIRHGNGVKCRACEEARITEREREKNIERDRRTRATDVNRLKNAKQIRLAVCASCGSLFTTWSDARTYCSKECCKRANRSTQGSDGRLNKSNIIDKDITLDKLFIRDKGICQICGGRCDYNDYRYNENGVFIAGEKYPSKDHIIELCNGGKHSWENVRLAHRGCNSKLFWERKRHPSRAAQSVGTT